MLDCRERMFAVVTETPPTEMVMPDVASVCLKLVSFAITVSPPVLSPVTGEMVAIAAVVGMATYVMEMDAERCVGTYFTEIVCTPAASAGARKVSVVICVNASYTGAEDSATAVPCTLTAALAVTIAALPKFSRVMVTVFPPIAYIWSGERVLITGTRSSSYVKEKEASFPGRRVGDTVTVRLPSADGGLKNASFVPSEEDDTTESTITASAPKSTTTSEGASTIAKLVRDTVILMSPPSALFEGVTLETVATPVGSAT
mmetsp:Transcript_39557/g.93494  ORF Transcript_39557/g.93494 Transcript_39557/m.93494 type:complete len:259 (-) Transcript_39557:1349-2125(-)